MIKFFRHIRLRLLTQESDVVNTKEEAATDKVRQAMISDNKASKYLRYAIGEIDLVVIGILDPRHLTAFRIKLQRWRKGEFKSVFENKFIIHGK